MQTMEMNKKAVAILEKWDPFKEGAKAYGHEIVDVVAELQSIDHPADLAKKIREIYEHSYQMWIPFEDCVNVSYKLLAIKYKAKCIV
ncbi:DUF1871 family protein [Sporosarcina sp. G11-34]|uniref:DUF1871 family protein n=1 Tax=Sporosarcina sp. G11-34 TaxID=2849605 RepID=UPI0022A9BD2E|nr:DUF1871 family protein [Sporosarcina sp. G11-34]MCZ2260443.1 YugE family protein [Sporosarcina sp. G11-34]